MLSKLTGEHQTYSSLNLSGRESRLLIVSGKLSSLGGDTLEDIIDEGVHDGHSLLGNSSVGVDLFEDLVNVRRVGFDTLLLGTAAGFLRGCCFLGRLLGRSLGHLWKINTKQLRQNVVPVYQETYYSIRQERNGP